MKRLLLLMLISISALTYNIQAEDHKTDSSAFEIFMQERGASAKINTGTYTSQSAQCQYCDDTGLVCGMLCQWYVPWDAACVAGCVERKNVCRRDNNCPN